MQISVIICTHNPRPDYFRRVLAALGKQTLPKDQWELLVIDNASKQPLAGEWDLSWHPRARHIREDDLGLTPARLRGIRESQGELLVFVDDDNVLSEDYVAQALRIIDKHPFLGAYSGTTEAELEGPIKPWQELQLCDLAVRKVERPLWANFFADGRCSPYGAGLVVVRSVATQYANLVTSDPLRRSLGRKGNHLAGYEDVDLSATAYDLGLATGLFPELILRHLIPPARLQADYLVRLKRESTASGYVFGYVRGGKNPPPTRSVWASPGRLLLWLKLTPFQKRMFMADQEARRAAVIIIERLKSGSGGAPGK